MGILLAIHVLVTLFLILVILIQKTEGGSSLFASGGGGNMFSARGASNMLTKATWILSSLFLINCVVMAVISSKDIDDAQTILNRNRSERDRDSTERAPQKQASDNKKPTTEQALMSVTSPVDKSDREPQNKASGNGKPKTVDAEKNQQKTESTQKKTENSPR